MWTDWFTYDESSPTCLRNKVTRYGGKDRKSPVARAGAVAGCCCKPYMVVTLHGSPVKVHTIVWEMHNEEIPTGFEVDHKDGDCQNNRVSNLRLVSEAVNQRNKKLPSTNSSGVVGVRLLEADRKGKLYRYWRAFWQDDKTGRQVFADFSISKLGSEVAWELACKARADAINRMNSRGAGYTSRHGT